MKEENTQGINTETATKDKLNTAKTTSNPELLDLRAGYVQHTSPVLLNTTTCALPCPFIGVKW